MGKANNLGDFMTDLADAIREKTGTTEPINPQDFSQNILDIKTGVAAVESNDVDFLDYDGTILYSYSKDDFLALTELPPLPTRKGLICQEWNWELETAKTQVTECGKCDIGATYITDDGKTRLYITIAAEGRMDVPLYIRQFTANSVIVDWGDGATETFSETGDVNATHHYNAVGDYIISLEVADGSTIRFGTASSSYCVMGAVSGIGKVYCNMLQRVEVGKGVKYLGTYAFNSCYSLTSVVIPKEVQIDGYAFQNCYSLTSVVIPKGVQTIGSYAFQNCHSLASVAISQGVTQIGSNAFYKCYSLASVVLHKGVSVVDGYAFNSCYSLTSVVIPKGVQTIGSYAFQNCHSLASVAIHQGTQGVGASTFYYCYSLASIVFPNGFVSINSNAFRDCSGVRFYDFSALGDIVTLVTTNAFTSIPPDCKIIVPDALYDRWIAATNWSTYASYIIKKSEWDAQNA